MEPWTYSKRLKMDIITIIFSIKSARSLSLFLLLSGEKRGGL